MTNRKAADGALSWSLFSKETQLEWTRAAIAYNTSNESAKENIKTTYAGTPVAGILVVSTTSDRWALKQ